MEAVKYDPKIHYPEICAWAEERQVGIPPFSGLPKTGAIVPGKCVLFLYETDSTVGFVESLVANPHCEKHEIPQAIDLCVKQIERSAKQLGIRYLIGHFFIPAVAEHAMRSGFKIHPETYRLLSKELTWDS